MSAKIEDFPLDVIGPQCEQLIARGAFILQKWTCEKCEQRLTASNLNVLVHHGHCQHCGDVTDLDKRGCNFALIQSTRRDLSVRELEQMLGLAEPCLH